MSIEEIEVKSLIEQMHTEMDKIKDKLNIIEKQTSLIDKKLDAGFKNIAMELDQFKKI